MKWFQIINRVINEKTTAEVNLYGVIGGDWDGSGVEALAFKNEFEKIPKNTEITLRVHSPGGSVFDGLAIYNTIAARKSDVTAHIDGIAASAASWIVMAANKVRMPKTARMMIHNAQGIAVGDRKELRQVADLLEQEDGNIADMYVAKTGKSKKAIQQMMEATTWMNGTEAVAMGFADELTDGAAVKNDFDLSAFRRVPGPENRTTETLCVEDTKDNMRNKNIALLTQLGVSVDNKLTDEQVEALLTQTLTDLKNKATAVADPAPARKTTPEASDIPEGFVPINRVTALENRLAAAEKREADERVARITNEVNELCAARQIDAKDWLPGCLTNESVVNALRKLPVVTAPDPVPFSGSVQNLGITELEEYRKLKPGEDRFRFAIDNYDNPNFARHDLKTFRKLGPQNSNTIDSGLVPNILGDALIQTMTNKLVMLNVFTREVALEPMKPKVPVAVTKFTTGTAAQSNATDFEANADSTLDTVLVTPAQITKLFHFTNAQLQQGFQLEKLALGSADIFCNKISDAVTAVMTAAIYGAGTAVGAGTAFDSADLPAIWVLAKNYPRRILLLDGSHLGYLLPTDQQKFALGQDGAYGFDTIAMQNRWTGAIANTCGFVCGPDAIAIAMGLPVDMPQMERAGLQKTVIQVPQLGIGVAYYTWGNSASRTLFGSFDLCFGAAAGDASQAKVLITS